MSVAAESVRRVVFHADDFGMNDDVNQGILVSFRDGLLTSTSLLANAPAAESACREWPGLIADLQSVKLPSHQTRRELGDASQPFDLGIHLNLTQGRPLTGDQYPAALLDENGDFPGVGKLFSRLSRSRLEQRSLVEAELRAQIEWMCDRGLRPTHLNGHQYVELIPAVAPLIPELLQRYSIPVVRVASESGLVRNVLMQGRTAAWGLAVVKRYFAHGLRRRLRSTKTASPDRFFGTAHAGRIDLPTLSRFLHLAAPAGCTEIGVHPGSDSGEGGATAGDAWFDPLRKQRSAERDWLCCAGLRDLLFHRRLHLGRLQLLRGAG